MSSQIACLRRSIVTLVAFVWVFSTVSFQMSPQIACLRGCKVTLVAFVWLFSAVYFKMTSQAAFHRWCILALVAVIRLFSSVFSNGLHEKRHSHIGCICLIYFHCKLFSSGFLHLHPLKQSHNFPFVWLPLCVVLCANGCFKLSQIHHCLLQCRVFHGILSLFSYTGGSTLYTSVGWYIGE